MITFDLYYVVQSRINVYIKWNMIQDDWHWTHNLIWFKYEQRLKISEFEADIVNKPDVEIRPNQGADSTTNTLTK